MKRYGENYTWDVIKFIYFYKYFYLSSSAELYDISTSASKYLYSTVMLET